MKNKNTLRTITLNTKKITNALISVGKTMCTFRVKVLHFLNNHHFL